MPIPCNTMWLALTWSASPHRQVHHASACLICVLPLAKQACHRPHLTAACFGCLQSSPPLHTALCPCSGLGVHHMPALAPAQQDAEVSMPRACWQPNRVAQEVGPEQNTAMEARKGMGMEWGHFLCDRLFVVSRRGDAAEIHAAPSLAQSPAVWCLMPGPSVRSTTPWLHPSPHPGCPQMASEAPTCTLQPTCAAACSREQLVQPASSVGAALGSVLLQVATSAGPASCLTAVVPPSTGASAAGNSFRLHRSAGTPPQPVLAFCLSGGPHVRGGRWVQDA